MLRLPAGDLPAVGISDYVITARVRTAGVEHAKARLSALFYAGHDTPIEESRAESELVRTGGAWKLVHVELFGKYPQATHISIELSLLQPEQYERRNIAEYETRLQDVNGAAWFDDVAVYLAPRIEMRTDQPGNIIVAPESARILMTIHDVVREDLRGRIYLRDLRGETVTQEDFELVRVGRTLEWSPHLLRYGWYEAILELHNGEQIVADESIAFAYLPADLWATDEKERFGIIAESVSTDELPDLSRLLSQLSSGSVWLPAWADDLTLEALGTYFSRPDPAIQALLYDHVRITFVLQRLPAELAARQRLEPASLLEVLRLGESAYADYLNPVLVKYGQQSSRWQIGRTGDENAFFSPDLPWLANAFHAKAQQFVPGPIVVLPWSLPQLPRPEIETRAGWTVVVPWALPLDAIASTILKWLDNDENAFVLEMPDADVFSGRAAINSMAKRAVIAWMLDAPCIAIEKPWTMVGAVRPQLSPRPEFAVWRQLAQRLSGKRVLGSYPVVEGARAFILSDMSHPTATGTIIAWNDSAPPEQAVIEMFLGTGDVSVVDLFGNADPVEREESGAHIIPLTADPVFIENVDVHLALFRARFGLQPGFIHSTFDEHYHFLQIENPWPMTISGELLLVEPRRWSFSPRHHIFSIPPGGTLRLPVTLRFPPSEQAGWHRLAAEVSLLAAEPMEFRIDQSVELGLRSVLLSPSVQMTDSDAIVMLQVTNRSSAASDYRAYVAHSAYGRLYRPVGELQPGESRLIYIKLPQGAQILAGQRISVGLVEVDGPGRLNMSVQAP